MDAFQGLTNELWGPHKSYLVPLLGKRGEEPPWNRCGRSEAYSVGISIKKLDASIDNREIGNIGNIDNGNDQKLVLIIGNIENRNSE